VGVGVVEAVALAGRPVHLVDHLLREHGLLSLAPRDLSPLSQLIK
jgi:hypothetical protein